jgi:hypothetical protein
MCQGMGRAVIDFGILPQRPGCKPWIGSVPRGRPARDVARFQLLADEAVKGTGTTAALGRRGVLSGSCAHPPRRE